MNEDEVRELMYQRNSLTQPNVLVILSDNII